MLGQLKTFQSRLLRWYTTHHRKLPWRAVGPDAHKLLDPYHILVSETMLQQTQVATVIPYYHRFLARFPTVESLATADQQDVLRLWQGLGYYSRARNLQKAAQTILADFQGQFPTTLEGLLTLPGVGRYTAGAIASIAHNRRAPILDGNVARVLCRLDAIPTDPREKSTNSLLWSRAEQILPHSRLGDFNSSLMELGATICTPRNPQCLLCPVQKHCQAYSLNLQDQIPPPRTKKQSPHESRLTLCIQHNNQWLIQQRPSTGRWASLWQFPTFPAPRHATRLSSSKSAAKPPDPSRATLHTLTGLPLTSPHALTPITHTLTHRRYTFHAFIYKSSSTSHKLNDHPTAWVTLAELDRYPLPRPHLKIASLLRQTI
jgi:A/G-specific adenine glycosylase